MSDETAFCEVKTADSPEEALDQLAKQMDELYKFRDYYFEHNTLEKAAEKNQLVEDRMNKLIEKFVDVDDSQLSTQQRAKFLYLKGRTFNVAHKYDPRASLSLSKSVKLNPRLVEAWNELGECYWKNLNFKEAKSSFEGAIKNERNKVALRCLSIILRQESSDIPSENIKFIKESVELAKEAVALDIKDGISWTVLGNAYLCHFFLIAQDPGTLKLCMSAYRQAILDPIAMGQPDLCYNQGVAFKYEEQYKEALECFQRSSQLDPSWAVPATEKKKLVDYLRQVYDLTKTRGKIKTKKLQQMVQSIDNKMLGPYGLPNSLHSVGRRRNISPVLVSLDELCDGANQEKVVLGKVIGSIHSENVVPFTFAMMDKSLTCLAVTVYNWADGRGVIIGDSVAVPEPLLREQQATIGDSVLTFKSIRVDNPMLLMVNGKKVGKNQIAGTRVTSTFQIR